MTVSVLIPVYNAEKYLSQAVESALMQPETTEIILADDGSTDDSLLVSRQLQAQHKKISVYQHSGGANRGEAATRNLLLEKANCDYVVFLDADDYFLPDRFKVALEVYKRDPSVDVVYEAHEIFYDKSEIQLAYIQQTTPSERLHYLCSPVPPEDLFRVLMTERNGPPGLPSLVVRRQAYRKLPRFNENLSVSPDAPMVFQMTALCRCAPGQLEKPVFMYRQHESNLYAGTYPANFQESRRIWLAWTRYFVEWASNNLDSEKQGYIDYFLIRHVSRIAPFRFLSKLPPRRLSFKVRQLTGVLALAYFYPHLRHSRLYWRSVARASIGQRLFR